MTAPHFGGGLGGDVGGDGCGDFSASRDEQLIATGWHAMPTFEQCTAPTAVRSHVRHASVQIRHVLSWSP